jgi:predicted transposase/invertase (TIGR01784 family)
MILGIDPKIDYAFKLLWGRDETQPLLIDLLNCVLGRDDGERVESVELLNPFNPKAAFDDKLSIVDVRARDQKGRLFNVEMQMVAEPVFTSRIVYYAARSHQQQLGEGDAYDKLRPTISIRFLNHILFHEASDYHLCFRLLEARHRFELTGDLEFHFLELPKFEKSAEELGEGIELWLYFLRHAEKMDLVAVPEPLRRPLILRALRELEMVTQDEIERVRYESRLDSEKVWTFSMRMSRQEGRQEGEKIGRLVGVVQTLEQTLGQPETPLERLSALSAEALDQMIADLRQRFQEARRSSEQ